MDEVSICGISKGAARTISRVFQDVISFNSINEVVVAYQYQPTVMHGLPIPGKMRAWLGF